ncbi:multidrug resistance-associated protein 1-like, partial [Aplysia californica]|uniref:Multidrug resistance-associated protein 1-like n=1 Tax=Aplysia californica TaxID=6500 RepID=A0ABM1W4P3_APLCA
LPWVPHVFLWLVAPLYLAFLMTSEKRSAGQHSVMMTRKMTYTLALILLTAVQIAMSGYQEEGEEGEMTRRVTCLYGRMTSLLLTLALLRVESSRCCTHSFPLFFFWSLLLLSDCLSFYTDLTFEPDLGDVTTLSLTVLALGGSVAQAVLFSLPDTSGQAGPTHPDDASSVLGKLLVSWATGRVWDGCRQGLTEDDVPGMAAQDRCRALTPHFERAWHREQERLKRHSRGVTEKTVDERKTSGRKEDGDQGVSLLRVLIRQFGLEFFTYQLIKLGFELTHFVQPVLVGYLLDYFQNRDSQPAWSGHAIVVAIFLTSLTTGLGHQTVSTSVDRVAMKVRTSLKLAIYKKTLSARNEERAKVTTGEIVSLLGSECDKMVNCCKSFFILLSVPAQLTVGLFMLYQQLNVGAVVALALILLLVPFNAWISTNLKRLETEQNDVKDERVKMMNEVLNGIKVLKLYAWEKSFLKRIMDIRDREVNLLKKMGVLYGGVDFIFRSVSIMVCIASFATFTFMGGVLDPATAFVANAVLVTMSRSFSQLYLVVPQFFRAADALTRLNSFLNLEDIPDDVVKRTDQSKAAVQITDGSFAWATSDEKNCLKNIDLTIPRGRLVAVVGMVGAGKSALLSAILGEMEKVTGEVKVQGRVAYVPQEAWILNTTLRENILFGSPMNRARYDKVLDACTLREDLKLLSAGDETLIGEKGINLSGGQKQRVSLGRALYADTDLYLLDDPLSAVDAHVGKSIFNSVISRQGALRDKTRVMVTHGVHWLPFVDTVVVMKDGQVSETGTYKQLLDHHGAFAQFVREVNRHDPDPDPELEPLKQKVFNRLTSLDEGTEIIESDEEDDYGDDDNSVSEDDRGNGEIISPGGKTLSVDEGKEEEEEEEEEEERSRDERDRSEDEEETETGALSWSVYGQYLSSFGYWYFLVGFLIFCLLIYFREEKEWSLARWSDDVELSNRSQAHTPNYEHTVRYHFLSFALCGCGEMVTAFVFVCLMQFRTYEAGKFHHNKLLVNILRSPMSFFDTTPNGRIINRFSKDIQSVDNLDMLNYIKFSLNAALFFFMILFHIPRIIPFMIPVVILYLALQHVYLANSRQLRRFISRSRSPIYVHLTETANGSESVRAYKAQVRFTKKMEQKVESFMRNQMTEHWFSTWYSFRIHLLGCLVTLISGLLLLADVTISPARVGRILSFSKNFLHCLSLTIRHASYMETELVSLERVIEYSNTPTEAAWDTEPGLVSSSWPEDGHVVLENYQTRYRPGLKLVLRGVSCDIRSGEKIGIVGRTGAGKSSLTMALFRLIEAASGRICLSGQHIASLGLHDVRGKLTILPQDPVIFGGTLRMNLDPLGEKSWGELWEALEHSHLKTFVQALPDKLDHECGEGGQNLSMGQRQLVCLARALLRQSKVLILDEATAGVDMETDGLIQKTIRREFRACTVLTIAHRLNTVLDYDRIMVLDSGHIKEMDSPRNLLADKNSVFYSMARDAKLV